MLAEVDDRVAALDGFSVAHRAQASVVGLAALGPLYAGPVVMREIEQLSHALESPRSPMLLVVGGAKVDDSLASTRYFLDAGKADAVITGGLVGPGSFCRRRGIRFNEQTAANMAAATRDLPQAVAAAASLLQRFGTDRIRLPVDVALGPAQGSPAERQELPVDAIEPQDPRHAGDIGLQTMARYAGDIARANTLVMNGPMGRYEWPCFARGNEEILRYAAYAAEARAGARSGRRRRHRRFPGRAAQGTGQSGQGVFIGQGVSGGAGNRQRGVPDRRPHAGAPVTGVAAGGAS